MGGLVGREQITIVDGAAPTLGTTTDPAVTTDAAGTVQQYLRGLVKLVAAKLAITVADGDNATQGVTTGAAVTTDANGTVQQYLRGIVKLVAAKIGVTIADGDAVTIGALADAAVSTDTTGSLSGKLRGVVKILANVWDSTLGRLYTSTNARRNGGVLHRSAIAAVDKLAVPGTLTNSAITEAGSTLANVAYYTAVSAYNRWGPTGPGTLPSTITPNANQAVRIAFAAVTGADGYDVFLSTDASAPKWVTRITETQRAAGGIASSVGGYAAGGAINSIDIGIVGTGLQCTVNPFVSNNAYTPATPTPINCAGFSVANVHVKLVPTDLRSLPTLSVIPFFQDQVSTADWVQGAVQSVGVLTAVGQSLEQDFRVVVDGATNMVVLVDTLTGQAPTASVWVELA